MVFKTPILAQKIQKYAILLCKQTIYTKAEKELFPENKVLKDEFSGKSSSFIQVFRPIPTIWLIGDSNGGNISSLASKVHHFSIFYGYQRNP